MGRDYSHLLGANLYPGGASTKVELITILVEIFLIQAELISNIMELKIRWYEVIPNFAELFLTSMELIPNLMELVTRWGKLTPTFPT